MLSLEESKLAANLSKLLAGGLLTGASGLNMSPGAPVFSLYVCLVDCKSNNYAK
jgi:hypothetical protein